MCWIACDYNTLEDGRQHGKLSCPLVGVETKVKSVFLLWHHHRDTNNAFQLKLAKQHFIYFKFHSGFFFEFLTLRNSKIAGFQFGPTKALQPDSSSGKNWEICSSADSEPSTTTQNEASADTWCMCFICIKC